MRTVTVSTEVFARIWSLRKAHEETEDAILRRVLGCNPTPESKRQEGAPAEAALKGFHDRQFDVHFEEGFEIFRNYLGIDYRAKASGGRWVLASTGRPYGSLNELSRAVGAKTENAWVNWFFTRNDERRPVSELRDPTKIRNRRKAASPITAEEL